MRGRSVPQQSVCKPSVKNCNSAVVRNGSFLWTADSENKFCNGVTELRTKEFCLSAGPEKESTCMHINLADDFTEVTDVNRNPVIAGNVETEHENSVKVSFMDVSSYTDGSITVEHTAISETGPITTDDSLMDTKCSHSLVGTRHVETSVEIGAFGLDSSLVGAENDDGYVGIGNVKSMSEDCLSPIDGLTTCSDNSGAETVSKNDRDALAEVPGVCVDPVTSEVIVSESEKILSEDLLEVSENITDPGTIKSVSVGAETKLSILNALSEVSEDHDIQGMRNVGSEPAELATKQVCNGIGPFHFVDGSSNSEINFRPVSVVCCNMHKSSCMSYNSVHDLQSNCSGSSFEVDGQECEQFRQGILIGDPSFTAQPSLSEGDNELQVNELFTSTSRSSIWLSSEQTSETSKSSYVCDIDTDLLAQYDTQTIHEVSPENIISHRTSHCCNNSDQKQISENCSRLLRSRRMTQKSEVRYTSDSSESNNNVRKTCMQHCRGTYPSVETAASKQISRCHVLPKVSLNTDTQGKECFFPTVSTLSSYAYKSPMEVSPVEVKQIETILWEGNVDEIIQLKDCSVNEGLSSQNEVENSKEILESYVQKAGSETKNGHIGDVNNDINGKNYKEGIELCVGERQDRFAVSTQTQSMLRKIFCQNGSALTRRNTQSASQACAVGMNTANGIHSKKLARRLQREKRKRLSLSFRRKVTSLTARGGKKLETNSIM
jgi:hypothetical protein